MNIDEVRLKQSIDKIETSIHKCKSVGEYFDLLGYFDDLNYIFFQLTGDQIFLGHNYSTFNNKQLEEYAKKDLRKEMDRLSKLIKSNKDFIYSCASAYTFNTLSICKNDVVRCHTFNVINEEEAKKMLLDFFSSFDSKTFEIVKELIDEKRIGVELESLGNGSGAFLCDAVNQECFITTNKKLNIYGLTIIAHELGHAVAYKKSEAIDNRRIKIMHCFADEVASIFYEYEFIKYLKDKVSVECYNESMNNFMCTYSPCVYSIIGLSVSPQEFSFVGKLPLENDYKKLDTENDTISNIKYTYGLLIALHFVKEYEENREDFNKHFHYFISHKNILPFDELISEFWDKDEFASCNLIKDELDNIVYNRSVNDKNIITLEKKI